MIDGKSLVPLIKGEEVDWEERSLFFYWTRKYPELYNNVALQKGRYRLVGHTDYDAGISDFELFDINQDPFEQNNVLGNDVVAATDLKQELDQYLGELLSSPNLADPQRIIIGSTHENPVILNRNDAEGDRGVWTQEEIYGKWRVSVKEGTYNIRFRFLNPLEKGGQMSVETGTIINQKKNTIEGLTEFEMKNITYPDMDCDIIPFYLIGGKRILPFWVEIEKID